MQHKISILWGNACVCVSVHVFGGQREKGGGGGRGGGGVIVELSGLGHVLVIVSIFDTFN